MTLLKRVHFQRLRRTSLSRSVRNHGKTFSSPMFLGVIGGLSPSKVLPFTSFCGVNIVSSTSFEKSSFSASEAPFFVVRSKSRENSLVANVIEYNWWNFTEQGVAIYFLFVKLILFRLFLHCVDLRFFSFFHRNIIFASCFVLLLTCLPQNMIFLCCRAHLGAFLFCSFQRRSINPRRVGHPGN